jgi:hypothetical protein
MTEAPEKPKVRKRRRWLWITLGLFVTVVLVLALALPVLLDVERYRGLIEQALAEQTGWDAELGKIEFSPWRGMVLTVSPATLSAPGGKTSRFEVETIEIRAQLWPLLRGLLEIRSISLDSPDILLVRNNPDEGWIVPVPPGGLASKTGQEPQSPGGRQAPGGAQQQGAETPAAGGRFRVTIDRVGVEGGRVRVEDRAGDPPLELELADVDLDIRPASGDFSGQGTLADGGGRVKWNGNMSQGARITLSDVPTVRLHPFLGPDLVHAGGLLSGDVDVTFPLALHGKFTGRNVTLLAGEKPFETVQVDLKVASANEVWTLSALDVDAGGLKLTGRGTLLPVLNLDLTLPATPLDAALRASPSVLPLPIDVRPPGEVDAKLHVEQPAGGELVYTAEGNVSAAEFHASEILPPARQVRARFALDREGALEVTVLDGTVAGGPAKGVARLSSIDPPGVLGFDGGLDQAQFGALLEGLLGDQAKRISGPTGLSADVALDMGAQQIDARALSGRVDLSSKEVSLPGWDLEGSIRRKIDEKLTELNLRDLVEKKLGGRAQEKSQPNAPAAPTTVFDGVELGIDLNAIPWKLDKLSLDTEHLRASGGGTFDPLAGTVDLRFTARLDPKKTAELVARTEQLKLLVDDSGQLTLPLHLEGAMLSPSIGVDFGKAFSVRLESEDTQKKVKDLLKGLIDRD